MNIAMTQHNEEEVGFLVGDKDEIESVTTRAHDIHRWILDAQLSPEDASLLEGSIADAYDELLDESTDEEPDASLDENDEECSLPAGEEPHIHF